MCWDAPGYYPSERDIVNMLDEVKYRDFTTTGELAESISYDDLLKLYINHRCADGLKAFWVRVWAGG